MRTDYEEHLETCTHCRARQRLHRAIDVALIGFTTLSVLAFILALAVIHRFQPLHSWEITMHLSHASVVLTMQAIAIAGLLLSLLAWLLVAVATPAPIYITGMALEQARVLQNRIPDELKMRRTGT
ncbi:hypothetical protein [Paracidobacterium acidisoli]|nr:hypothetical protein [Paracidobacterium acidisoli]